MVSHASRDVAILDCQQRIVQVESALASNRESLKNCLDRITALEARLPADYERGFESGREAGYENGWTNGRRSVESGAP